MLIAEPLAGAAHAADDFVDDQQNFVLLADFLHPLPVAFRRGDDAAARGYGFEDQRAHSVGAFAEDDLLNRVGRLHAIVRAIPLRTVLKAVRHGDKAGCVGAVLGLPLLLTARRQRGDGCAVIVALAVEDLVLLAAVFLVRDLADDLVGLLVRFGTGVGHVDPAHPRHLGDQPLGEECAGDRPDGVAEEIDLHQLVADRVGDAFAAITDIHRPDAARDRVEMLPPVGVPDAHALALDQDQRVGGLVFLMLAQMVPDMGLVGLDDVAVVVPGMNVHRLSPP